MQSIDNNDLIEPFTKERKQVFYEVYASNYRALCFYAQKFSISREEAEDLVSDVFVRLFRKNQTGNAFESTDHIKNFLFAATRNAVINHKRTLLRQSGYKQDFVHLTGQQESGADNHRIEVEMLQMIYEAIESLPEECKRIFKMFFLQGHSYHDIANALNIAPQTARNQKSRALMLLRKHLSKPYAEAMASLCVSTLIFISSLIR